MSAPLSHKQKRLLSQLSDRAFDRASAEADGQYFYDDLPATTARAQFRHDQVAKACGKLGLRCCGQDDYKLVEAHFLNLLGETGRALNAHLAAATESRRVIERKILDACREFGFGVSYADKICRAQNKGLGLQDVDEKRLWNIFYTVRNRGLARKQTTKQPSHEYEHQSY